MRTRTNIYTGSGLSDFAKAIKGAYQAGGMAIISKDKNKAKSLISHLGESDYKFFIFTPNEAISASIKDFVRLVVGIGDLDTFRATKMLFSKKRCVFYMENIDYQYFLPDNTKNYAEFLYYDKEIINVGSPRAVIEMYVSAFSVLTELISIAYYESGMPFVDKGLVGIIKALKAFLFIGCDKDKYIPEGLRLIKMSIDYLHDREINSLYIQKAQELYKEGLGNNFLVAYFANMVLFFFTKWNFHDILIPAENLAADIPAADSFGLDKGILLTKEELHLISFKTRGQLALPGIDFKKIFSALQNACGNDNPLFAGINNRGIIRGLIGYD